MSVSSAGSALYRRLWINRFYHDILISQHSRSVSLATKQTQRLSSQINHYQHPPSFLTPTAQRSSPPHLSPIMNAKTTTVSKRNWEKVLVQQIKSGHAENISRLLADLYQSGHIPSITSYNHIIKALAKQFYLRQRQMEAQGLLEDMEQRGITPNSQTYIQMLLGYIIHTSSSIDTPQIIHSLFERLLYCESQQGYKRTHHKVKKLIEVMAGTGHASILPVMITCIKAGVRLDVTICNNALAGCIKGGHMDAGEQLLDLMRYSKHQQQDEGWAVIPDATSYHTIISGYLGRNGGLLDMDRAIELFQRMMDDGVTADYRIYQDFLCAYAAPSNRHDHIQDVNQSSTLERLWQAMITTMTRGQKVGDHILLPLLDYYIVNQGYSAMERVYWDLRERDHTLSRRTVIYFFKAISGYAQKQHLLSGIAMFYDLVTQGHGANHSATSSLLHACILRGQLDMAQQIMDVIEEISQRPASSSHYALMVQAYIQQGQLESANIMFDKLRQHTLDLQSSTSTSLSKSYEAMILGYFKAQKLDMAESLFDQYIDLQDTNGKMDRGLINVMLEGYGQIGNKDKLDAFLGRQDVDINSLGSVMILIQSRLDHGNVTEAERDLRKGLEQYGVKSLLSSIQSVLSGLALNGDVASCEYWTGLLFENDLMMDISYEALLVCYGTSGETIKLKQVYDKLHQKGVQLDHGLENKVKYEWLKTHVHS